MSSRCQDFVYLPVWLLVSAQKRVNKTELKRELKVELKRVTSRGTLKEHYFGRGCVRVMPSRGMFLKDRGTRKGTPTSALLAPEKRTAPCKIVTRKTSLFCDS